MTTRNRLAQSSEPAPQMTAAKAREWQRIAADRGHRDKAALWAAYAAELEQQEAASRPTDGKMKAAGE